MRAVFFKGSISNEFAVVLIPYRQNLSQFRNRKYIFCIFHVRYGDLDHASSKPFFTKIPLIEERADQPVCDRRNDEGIGLGDRLQACHQVGSLADRSVLLGHALPHQIPNDNDAGANGDAGLHHYIRGGSQASDCLENGKSGKDRPLSVILVRRGVPEICKHPSPKVLGDHAAEGLDLVGAAVVKRGYDLTLLLGIKARGERA
jgi:hypothetical protein